MKKILFGFLTLILVSCSVTPTAPITPSLEVELTSTVEETIPSTATLVESTATPAPTETQVPLTPEEQLSVPLLPETFHEYFNPVALGERGKVEVGGRKFYVRVLDVSIGQDDILAMEGPDVESWPVHEFMKYVVVKIGIEYMDSEDNTPIALLTLDNFAIVSNGHAMPVAVSGQTYDPAVGDKLLRPGQNDEGYLVGLAYEEDETPYLRLRFEGVDTFFDLLPPDTVWPAIEIYNNVVIPFEEESIGSRDAPVPIGETRAWYDENSNSFFHITVDDVLRRFEVLMKLTEEYGINRAAPEGYEYVLPLVTIQYMGGQADEPFVLDDNFYLPGMDETVAASFELTGCGNPCLTGAQELYPGGVARVWIPLLTPSEEPGLSLAFNDALYFNAVKDISQVEVAEVIIDPWIGYNSILYMDNTMSLKVPTVVFAMSISPDDTILAAASDDRKIYLFDLASGELRNILEGHSIAVRDISFSPDGSLLASVSYSGEVFIWSTADWSLRSQWDQGGTGLFARFLADQRLVTGNTQGNLTIWNVETGEILREIRTPREMNEQCSEAYIQNYDVSADGTTFMAALSCHFGVVWNPDTRLKFVESNHSIESKKYPIISAVALSPDGRRGAYGSVYYVRYRKVFMNVWTIEPENESARVSSSVGTATLDMPAAVWSPNGELLVAAVGSFIHIWWPGRQNWDRPDYRFFTNHESQVTALEFSTDAMVFASADYFGNILIWKIIPPE